MPLSVTFTRKLSRPRMMGRLAPGANVLEVMPGWVNRMSPRVLLGFMLISRLSTTVTGTKAPFTNANEP